MQNQQKIPGGWKETSLDQISDKIGDGLHSTPKYTENTKYFFINGNNISNGKIVINKNTKSIDQQEYLKYKINLNDKSLLLSINGTIGNVGYYGGENIILGKSAAFINCNNLTNEKFIFYFLNSLKAKNHFANELSGSTISNLSLKSIRNTKLSIPSLPEQNCIVLILETWDKYLENLDQKIKIKKNIKKYLAQELLNGKIRLEGFNQEWKAVKFGEICKIEKGKTLSSSDLKIGSYPVIAGGKTSPYSHGKFTHEKVITISASGAYAGYVSFHPNKIWASDCSVIEAVKNKTDIIFLYYFLLNKQKQIYSLQSGGAQPHIYPKDIKNINIDIPTIKEQTAIANILIKADQEISVLEKQREIVKAQKKYLLNKLITGQIRLPEFVKKAETI